MEYNLDCMPAEDLLGFAKKYRGKTELALTEVLGHDTDPKLLRMPEIAEYARVVDDLIFYALCKALAMTMREFGRVQTALDIEVSLENLYASFPWYARW